MCWRFDCTDITRTWMNDKALLCHRAHDLFRGFRARSNTDTARIRFATISYADMTDTTPPKSRSPGASASAGKAARDAGQAADPLHKIRVDVSANYVGEQS